MESSFYNGQPVGEPSRGAAQYPLQSAEEYGVANQFAGVEQLKEQKSDGDGEQAAQQPRIKRKRASKACDACRVRKVKCDVTRNPCPQCAEHGIPCLFTVPARKRGPPNAYVEAQKAKMARDQDGHSAGLEGQPGAVYTYLEGQQSQQLPEGRQYATQPPAPEIMYHAHSPSFGPPASGRPDMGLEELANPDVLNALFDDFFTFVYPIVPIVLESQFRRTLSNPQVYTNDFLALCAGILAVTVVCLRSNADKYGGLTFESCQQFALTRLGLGFRERINVTITATLEFLSLSSSFLGQIEPPDNTRAAMFRAEAACAVQSLIYSKLMTNQLNFVDQQLLKRCFTHSQYFHSALTLQGRHARVVYTPLSPEDITEKEMMPLDLSDLEIERISETGDDNAKAAGQFVKILTPSVKSYVPALILQHGLYKIYAQSDAAHKDESLAATIRFEGMYSTLLNIRHYLDNVPVQLRWEENNKVHGIGFEVQKANLYVARMHLSSVLLEKCHMLEARSPGASGGLDLEKERRLVISETLRIIKTISRSALEANGRAMVKRVRQVASTLTEIIHSQKGSEHKNAKDELDEFAKILSDLDPSDARDGLGQAHEESWRRFKHEQNAGSS